MSIKEAQERLNRVYARRKKCGRSPYSKTNNIAKSVETLKRQGDWKI